MNETNSYITRLVEVTKRYEGPRSATAALSNISFAASSGETVLFLGPSGSGKTTLLTLMAGFQRPTSGQVYLFGKQIREFSIRELQSIRAFRIGFIFQAFFLIDSLTVLQNVMMVRRFAGADRTGARQSSLEYLRRFKVDHLAGSFPSKISQGEKQRVAIARALVNGAELIIADEPTGSLASKQGLEIIEFLKQSSHEENRCVIITSHDERIISYADRVYHLSDGKLTDRH